MSRKQVQMQSYRLVTAADLSDQPVIVMDEDATEMPHNEALAQNVIDTSPFDGVRLDIDLAVDGGGGGCQLEVLFLDRKNNTLTLDSSQTILIENPGREMAKVVTSGRPVYIRVAALSGDNAVLTITQGAFSDSKI